MMVDAGLDSRGDAWEVGARGSALIVTLNPGAWQLDFEGGSAERDRFTEAVARATSGAVFCAHCGNEIVPCAGGALPVCKGWIHAAYAERHPVGAHYCGARSVNPSAEPASPESSGAPS